MKNNKFRVLIIVFFLMSLSLSVSSVRAESVLHFSDIISGPKTGLGDGLGEGAIITIWGNNLGSFQGSSKVYFKDSLNHVYESAYVYYWVNADGQSGGGPADLYTFHKMQEIAFSIPSSVTDGLGKMYVEVGGINSNELNFTVREGNIYFVDINSTNDPGIGTYSDSGGVLKLFIIMLKQEIFVILVQELITELMGIRQEEEILLLMLALVMGIPVQGQKKIPYLIFLTLGK